MHTQSFSVAAASRTKHSEKETAALAGCTDTSTGNEEKGRSQIRNARITEKVDPKGGKIKIHQSIETPLCQEQVLLISQPNRLQLVEGREQILYNIKQEYKRMQKRRHLETSFQPTDPCCSSEGHPQTFIPSGPTLPGTSATSPLRKEQPLFSLRQVGMICERLLKEREDKIREEYEEILTTKLAEQYDAFVKFTHDQIMRRFGEQPASYVS
ncbi:akirin-2 isoform X2 [Xenopus laevis]|uniref:Akirin-2 n=1 Tax=Xenopus laevis TaxID=8355 RepID=A0A8J0VGR9_XENLA|nr:akirin-2 isoform X2 [Xenopus laevis]